MRLVPRSMTFANDGEIGTLSLAFDHSKPMSIEITVEQAALILEDLARYVCKQVRKNHADI
jgi:hypothetical protein